MNLKNLRRFIIDNKIFPGYYAKPGMTFIRPGYLPVSMKPGAVLKVKGLSVESRDEEKVVLCDDVTGLRYNVLLTVIKPSSIVRVN